MCSAVRWIVSEPRVYVTLQETRVPYRSHFFRVAPLLATIGSLSENTYIHIYMDNEDFLRNWCLCGRRKATDINEKKKASGERRGADLHATCHSSNFLQVPPIYLAFFHFIHSGVVDHLYSSIVFFDKGVPVAAAAVVEGPVFLLFPFHFDKLLVSALALGYGVGF